MPGNQRRRRALQTLESAQKALKMLPQSLPALLAAEELLRGRAGKIIVTGVGKSGYIGQKIAATLTSLGHRSSFLHPVEAFHGDIGAISVGDVVIAISFSGESMEVVKLAKYLRKEFDVKVIAVTKSTATTLGRLSDVVAPLNIKDEGCPLGVAPMASTTATLVLGDMLAAALTEPDTFKKDHFARLHPGGGLALSLRTVKDVMRRGEDMPIVASDRDIVFALNEMSKKKLGITGVVDKRKRLVGVVTDGDIRRFLAGSHFVRDAKVVVMMTRHPKSINSKATLKDALSLMEKYRITSLFVFDKTKQPTGIIHIHDIVEGTIL